MMDRYLIEYRLYGYAKSYIRKIIAEVSYRFRVRGSKVPHITFLGPFTLQRSWWTLGLTTKADESKLVEDFKRIVSTYHNLFFMLTGVNGFPNAGVVYIDVKHSEAFGRLHRELYAALAPYCKLGAFDPPDNRTFHTTIAQKLPLPTYRRILAYLYHKKAPTIRQRLLRLTFMKGGRILYEYDLFQRRLLTRKEALDRTMLRRTIELLKQTSKAS
jgi:2'-5' RNA ligase